MLRRSARLTFGLMAAMAAAAPLSLGGFTHAAFAQSAEPIRVGLVVPVTGAASRWGAFAIRATTLASTEINAGGGLQGRKIELVTVDDQCAPAEGVSAVQRLLNINKVDFIVGPLCSSVAKSVQPIIEAAKIPMILASTSDPEITYRAGVGGFKWTFRNYPTDETRVLVVLEQAYKEGNRKFSILAVDNDFGRAIVQLHDKYKSRFPGMEIASTDLFSLKETDFRPILAKVRSAGTQVVLFYATAGDTIQLVGRQIMELGMAGKVKVMGFGDLTQPDNLKLVGPVLEGAVEAALWLPQWEHARSQKFVQDYQAANGGEVPNSIAYSFWETMHLAAKAITVAKGTEGAAFNSALVGLEYESAMGKVRFDDHHQANLPMLLMSVKGGKPTVLGSHYSQPDYPAPK